MAEMDVYEVEEKVPSKRIDIQYRRPKTYRRVFARIIDLLLLLLIGVLLFLGLRAIVNNTQTAKDALARIDETMVESGVYVEVEGEQIDLISIWTASQIFPTEKGWKDSARRSKKSSSSMRRKMYLWKIILPL